MIKKRYILVALGVISALLGSLLYSSVISAPGGEYDPWLDYNEDGIVDVNDLHSLSQVYSASGDPTKNVNVTNWPVSETVAVWWAASLGAGGHAESIWYNASGFGHLHIMAACWCPPGEELNIEVQGRIQSPDHVYSNFIVAYSFTLNETVWWKNYEIGMVGITIPVPSDAFRFVMDNPSSTTVDFIDLCFYLTWS